MSLVANFAADCQCCSSAQSQLRPDSLELNQATVRCLHMCDNLVGLQSQTKGTGRGWQDLGFHVYHVQILRPLGLMSLDDASCTAIVSKDGQEQSKACPPCPSLHPV